MSELKTSSAEQPPQDYANAKKLLTNLDTETKGSIYIKSQKSLPNANKHM